MTGLFNHPAGESMTCPRCHHIFERPIMVDGKAIRGHVIGDPATCKPDPGVLARDARDRKALRRGG